MMSERKPKFKHGQVVAIWNEGKSVPNFYRIKGHFFDGDDKIRYTFDVREGDSLAHSLLPVEKLLRPLTKQERGA
jgi:hypothetical protein